MSDVVTFDGLCPFLTCTKTRPHEHQVCEACGAVRYGNPFGCTRCQVMADLLGDDR